MQTSKRLAMLIGGGIAAAALCAGPAALANAAPATSGDLAVRGGGAFANGEGGGGYRNKKAGGAFIRGEAGGGYRTGKAGGAWYKDIKAALDEAKDAACTANPGSIGCAGTITNPPSTTP